MWRGGGRSSRGQRHARVEELVWGAWKGELIIVATYYHVIVAGVGDYLGLRESEGLLVHGKRCSPC